MYTNAINRLMEKFDFEKVRAYMLLSNWTYRGDKNCPTIENLQNVAYTVLFAVAKSDKEFSTASTGGFTAIRAYGNLYLHFALEDHFTGLDY